MLIGGGHLFSHGGEYSSAAVTDLDEAVSGSHRYGLRRACVIDDVLAYFDFTFETQKMSFWATVASVKVGVYASQQITAS